MTSAILEIAFWLFVPAPQLDESCVWHTSYAKALDEVHRTDRPLYVLFDSGSSDIGKMVSSGLYVSDEVEKALAADFLRMFVDTETEAGKALARQFGVSALPKTVVIDRSGDWQVYRHSGHLSSDELLVVLAHYRRSKLSSPGGSPNSAESRFYPPSSSAGAATHLCKT